MFNFVIILVDTNSPKFLSKVYSNSTNAISEQLKNSLCVYILLISINSQKDSWKKNFRFLLEAKLNKGQELHK